MMTFRVQSIQLFIQKFLLAPTVCMVSAVLAASVPIRKSLYRLFIT